MNVNLPAHFTHHPTSPTRPPTRAAWRGTGRGATDGGQLTLKGGVGLGGVSVYGKYGRKLKGLLAC